MNNDEKIKQQNALKDKSETRRILGTICFEKKYVYF